MPSLSVVRDHVNKPNHHVGTDGRVRVRRDADALGPLPGSRPLSREHCSFADVADSSIPLCLLVREERFRTQCPLADEASVRRATQTATRQ